MSLPSTEQLKAELHAARFKDTLMANWARQYGLLIDVARCVESALHVKAYGGFDIALSRIQSPAAEEQA